MTHLQISESFNRFGVTDSCQHLLVARFDAEPSEVSDLYIHLLQVFACILH